MCIIKVKVNTEIRIKEKGNMLFHSRNDVL